MRAKSAHLTRTSLPLLAKTARYVFLCCFLAACAPGCIAEGQTAEDLVGSIVRALRDKDYARALSLSQSALAARPGDFRIWTLRGMASAGTGDLAPALTAYQHALKL